MGRLSPRNRQIAHVLRTRSPVVLADPRDLHVLSTPPAFVLSQDQTLQWIVRISSRIPLSLLLINAVRIYLSEDSVIRITENVRSKLSLLPRTGRRSTSSPRTSVIPKFNYQTALPALSRIPRQPLIIPLLGVVVKRLKPQIHAEFARPNHAGESFDSAPRRLRDRSKLASLSAPQMLAKTGIRGGSE